MIPSRLSHVALAGCLLPIALTGCLGLKPAVDTTRFYVLTAAPPAARAPASAPGPTVMLGRVEVADYLRSPQLAIRVESNRIEYSGLHHWAEPLHAALPRVIEENLLLRLAPRPSANGSAATREIRLSFQRFDLTPAGTARTEVICRVLDAASREPVAEKRLAWESRATVSPSDFGAGVATLSAQLGTLADEAIALAQGTLPITGPGRGQ